MAQIIWWVPIQWFRTTNGSCVPITKIVRISNDPCADFSSLDTYSDWGTATEPSVRTEWMCRSFDSEITCVEENDNLYMLKWDESTNTYKVFDLSQDPPLDVTWTVTPKKCESSNIESDNQFWCIDWDTYTQWVVKDNWVPSWDVYWTNSNWVTVSDPRIWATSVQNGHCDFIKVFETFAFIATNADPITIPVWIKSFSITNLWENWAGLVYTDIVCTGWLNYTMLWVSPQKWFSYNVINSTDQFTGNIVVTPAWLWQAEILYII